MVYYKITSQPGENIQMPRKSVTTAAEILAAAQNFIEDKNNGNLTARNLASYMDISTQPIYKAFGSMGELKVMLFDQIFNELRHVYLSKETHPDPVINLALNYIQLAQVNSGLFRAIYFEKNGSNNGITEFSWGIFNEVIQNEPTYSHLSEDKRRHLMHGTWVVATGMANLISSETIGPSQDDVVRFLEDIIAGILELDSMEI
jgi:AcrR family transcriptional regulator